VPARRLTPRGRERRAQLIAVATNLFASKGYHPTSVADIVDSLGVGKGVFYWYFSSKEELFVEILRTSQKDLRRRQQKAIADIVDPVERIAAGMRAGVQWSAEHRELFQLFEFAQTDERFAPAMRAGRAVLVKDAMAPLREAIDEGRIPEGDPEQLAHAVLGVSSLLTAEYIFHRAAEADAIADTVVQFCLRGLGAA
jgi:AcrR family transcriptional regulator